MWFCGQCVDCKACGNVLEKRGASFTYWSRDPEKCYRCGGCKGLVETKGKHCPVCSRLWRADDDDLVQCSSCDLMVHASCDFRANEILSRQVSVSEQKHPKVSLEVSCIHSHSATLPCECRIDQSNISMNVLCAEKSTEARNGANKFGSLYAIKPGLSLWTVP